MLKIGTRVKTISIGGFWDIPIIPYNRVVIIIRIKEEGYDCIQVNNSLPLFFKFNQVVPLRIAKTEIYKALTEE